MRQQASNSGNTNNSTTSHYGAHHYSNYYENYSNHHQQQLQQHQQQHATESSGNYESATYSTMQAYQPNQEHHQQQHNHINHHHNQHPSPYGQYGPASSVSGHHPYQQASIAAAAYYPAVAVSQHHHHQQQQTSSSPPIGYNSAALFYSEHAAAELSNIQEGNGFARNITHQQMIQSIPTSSANESSELLSEVDVAEVATSTSASAIIPATPTSSAPSTTGSPNASTVSPSANLIDESATYKDADIEHTSDYIKVVNVHSGRQVVLTNDQLTFYSVRKLNQIVSDFPKQTIKKLKQRRRTLKNRGYAQNCRHKRLDQKNKLEHENENLKNEISRLNAELRFCKGELKNFKTLYEQRVYNQQIVNSGAGSGNSNNSSTDQECHHVDVEDDKSRVFMGANRHLLQQQQQQQQSTSQVGANSQELLLN